MMYKEFLEMGGPEISYEDYKEIVEPMYMAAEKMNKQEFIKFITPSCKALAKANQENNPKPKNIKKMCVRDRSGYRKTPNNCWYHIKYVELVDIDIATAKFIVKPLEDKDFDMLLAEGRSLDLSTEYDFDYTRCMDAKRRPIELSWF